MFIVPDRFFDYYILGALGSFFCLVSARAILMRLRGAEITGVNRQTSAGEKLEDVLGGVCPVIRFYETIAYALPIGFHLGPAVLGKVIVSAVPLKTFGAVLWAVALWLYASAHWVFGISWRLRVGSDSPGELISRGIFGYSRNPIYVSFVLMTVGTFLVLGQLIFLLLALIAVFLLHKRILREERFLLATHGSAYETYCSRVSRYWNWPPWKASEARTTKSK
jgi:protein-S-isoprenylcysteine O-methyltransferase Ste14